MYSLQIHPTSTFHISHWVVSSQYTLQAGIYALIKRLNIQNTFLWLLSSNLCRKFQENIGDSLSSRRISNRQLLVHRSIPRGLPFPSYYVPYKPLNAETFFKPDLWNWLKIIYTCPKMPKCPLLRSVITDSIVDLMNRLLETPTYPILS